MERLRRERCSRRTRRRTGAGRVLGRRRGTRRALEETKTANGAPSEPPLPDNPGEEAETSRVGELVPVTSYSSSDEEEEIFFDCDDDAFLTG